MKKQSKKQYEIEVPKSIRNLSKIIEKGLRMKPEGSQKASKTVPKTIPEKD